MHHGCMHARICYCREVLVVHESCLEDHRLLRCIASVMLERNLFLAIFRFRSSLGLTAWLPSHITWPVHVIRQDMHNPTKAVPLGDLGLIEELDIASVPPVGVHAQELFHKVSNPRIVEPSHRIHLLAEPKTCSQVHDKIGHRCSFAEEAAAEIPKESEQCENASGA